MAETIGAMMLDDVMQLDGRELDAAVCKHVFGWEVAWLTDALGRAPIAYDATAQRSDDGCSSVRMIGGSWQRGRLDDGRDIELYGRWLPQFSKDWNAAMQVREWGRDNIEDWSYEESVFKVMGKRLGWQVRRVDLVAFLEPRDLARAALLVSP